MAKQLASRNHAYSTNPGGGTVCLLLALHSETNHLVGTWAILLSLACVCLLAEGHFCWEPYILQKHTSNYKTDFFNLLFFLFFPIHFSPPFQHTFIYTHTCPHTHTYILPFMKGRNLSIDTPWMHFFSFFSLEMCNLYLYFSWFFILPSWVMILILVIAHTEIPLHVLDWSEIFLHIFPS